MAYEPGLRLLVACPEPAVDIIAVHGLGANPKSTWVKPHPVGVAAQARDDGYAPGRMWLKDLLPQSIPEARILKFNYSSNVFNNVSKVSLRSIATNLVLSIVNDRKSNNTNATRPIIFIGHSFGGVVIEEALVYAYSQTNPQIRSIVLCTVGVVFLGTPHRGSLAASWGVVATKCALAVGYQPHDGLLKTLEQGSERQVILLNDFTCMALTLRMKLVCFYETRQTSVLKGILGGLSKTMIVEQLCATLDCFTPIALDADHCSMNEYYTAEDCNYILVQSQIRNLIGSAKGVIESRHASAENYFMVPYQENDLFTTRGSIAHQLNHLLARKKANEQLKIAIHGLGGAGKTQIGLDFAYKSRQAYNIFWIHGSSIDTFTANYSEIAICVKIAAKDLNQDELCQAAKTWLESDSSEDWLLIIDNADELTIEYTEVVKRFLPKHKGTVLFTSRDRSIAGKLVKPHFSITLDIMTLDEAIQTFTSLLQPYDANLELDKAHELVKCLGYLPLAIVQAAAYIRENDISINEYLQLFAKSTAKLLAEPFNDVNHAEGLPPRAVMSTWNISQQYIKRENSSAAALLDIMSLLDCQEIPKTLLMLKVLGLDLDDELDFNKAILALTNFALVSSSIAGSITTYRVHPLVSLWTRHNILKPTEVRSVAICLFESTFPDINSSEYIHLGKPLIPHMDSIISHCTAPVYSPLSRSLVSLKVNKAEYLLEAGLYQQAKDLFLECRDFYQLDAYEDKNTSSLLCTYQLGRVFDKQGKYAAALDWYRLALDGYGEALGKEHQSTFNIFNSMACVFMNQGKYDESLEWYERALAGQENVLGKEHPSTLLTVNNMAMVFFYRGKYDKALEWYERALAGNVKVLGKKHPLTLDTMDNIASVFQCQGKNDEALEWNERVLASREQVQGKEHPSTLLTVNSMAIVFYYQGKHDKALEWYERVLASSEKALGKEHPSTLDTVHNIANVFQSQGKYDKALEWCGRALAGKEKVLGKEHTSTLNTVNVMGYVFRCQGNYDKAFELYKRALAGHEKVLGKEHTSTLNVVRHIADVFHSQDMYEDALEWYKRALAVDEKALGKDHLATLDTTYNIALVYELQGNSGESLRYFCTAYLGYEKVLGYHHQKTADARAWIEYVQLGLSSLGAQDAQGTSDGTKDQSAGITVLKRRQPGPSGISKKKKRDTKSTF